MNNDDTLRTIRRECPFVRVSYELPGDKRTEKFTKDGNLRLSQFVILPKRGSKKVKKDLCYRKLTSKDAIVAAKVLNAYLALQ